jgi:hypothetical protein
MVRPRFPLVGGRGLAVSLRVTRLYIADVPKPGIGNSHRVKIWLAR